MTEQTKEQQEAFTRLATGLKSYQEQQEREYDARIKAQQNSFFGAIPENTTSLYIHLSHRISNRHPFVTGLQTKYGLDNVLVTTAPRESGQSSYNNSRDQIAEAEKTKLVIEPFEKFSATKSIDAIVYLCNYLCDGYQSPIFHDAVVTQWHIWRAIKVAQFSKKPIIIGYQDDFCFRSACYEREYSTNPEEMKCQTTFVYIRGN